MSRRRFKAGDRVRLSPDGENYDPAARQWLGTIATVRRVGTKERPIVGTSGNHFDYQLRTRNGSVLAADDLALERVPDP